MRFNPLWSWYSLDASTQLRAPINHHVTYTSQIFKITPHSAELKICFKWKLCSMGAKVLIKIKFFVSNFNDLTLLCSLKLFFRINFLILCCNVASFVAAIGVSRGEKYFPTSDRISNWRLFYFLADKQRFIVERFNILQRRFFCSFVSSGAPWQVNIETGNEATSQWIAHFEKGKLSQHHPSALCKGINTHDNNWLKSSNGWCTSAISSGA